MTLKNKNKFEVASVTIDIVRVAFLKIDEDGEFNTVLIIGEKVYNPRFKPNLLQAIEIIFL